MTCAACVRKDSSNKLFFKVDFDEQNSDCVSQSSSQKWPTVKLSKTYSKRLPILWETTLQT